MATWLVAITGSDWLLKATHDTCAMAAGKGVTHTAKIRRMNMARIEKTPEEWRASLSTEEFQVCRLGGTERPFSGKYHDSKEPGTYHCVCCDAALFDSSAKFDSGCGWPSYFQAIDPAALLQLDDHSHGMRRTEVRCAACNAHLGHVFPDGPKPTGLRYCINSVCLRLVPRDVND
jgi:peptide-methionine (R)-S-oxide reductase